MGGVLRDLIQWHLISKRRPAPERIHAVALACVGVVLLARDRIFVQCHLKGLERELYGRIAEAVLHQSVKDDVVRRDLRRSVSVTGAGDRIVRPLMGVGFGLRIARHWVLQPELSRIQQVLFHQTRGLRWAGDTAHNGKSPRRTSRECAARSSHCDRSRSRPFHPGTRP